MNSTQADLLRIYCRQVREAPTQEQADRLAATFWQTVAVAAPSDASVARDALTGAAALWGKAVAS